MNINPVMKKELKVRMRNWKAAGMIAAYVGVLILVVVFILLNTVMDPYYSSFSGESFMAIYNTLAIIQFMLITFIVPALTAGSISGERERQTLDLLLCTKLSTKSIILGKLFTSINQILLLIVASLPVFSIIFLFGGISIIELIQLLVFYIVLTITIGSIGIFFSTHLKRTTPATVLTYAFTAFLILGTIFFAVFYVRIYLKTWSSQETFPLMYLNPLAGFGSLLASQFGMENAFNIPGVYVAATNSKIPFWIVNSIINLIMAGIFLFLSALKLNPTKKKGRVHFRNKKRRK